MYVTCMTTVATTQMKKSACYDHVNHGSFAVATTSVWPRPGCVMATMTVRIDLMKRTVVSKDSYAWYIIN